MPSIPISGLNTFSTITGSDFIPLVDSSSLTTYRSTIDALQLYLNTSGSSIPLLASSSISSSYSTFAKFASSSFAATSASWASQSFASVSASWSSASISSSYSQTSSFSLTSSFSVFSRAAASSSWASSSLTVISASWASQSFASVSSSWASASISSSYATNALSASRATTSSYALTASVLVPIASSGATKFFNNIGASWMVSNPGGAFANGNDLYVYNYDQQSTQTNMCKINMRTNVVTYMKQWPYPAWNWYGHLFRSAADGDAHALFYTHAGLYDYNVTDNIVTLLDGAANWTDLPVIVDFTDAVHPTVWALLGSWQASGAGDYPTFYLRKHYWNGSGYVVDWGIVLNLISVNNASAMIPFFSSATSQQSVARKTYMWDYNYIKKRYYLVDDATGYLHLFNHTTDAPNTSWFASSITYEKTLAIPLPHVSQWGDTNVDRLYIDYDIDTGEEKGIIIIRRGYNGGSFYLLGSVTYVNWPEGGNW